MEATKTRTNTSKKLKQFLQKKYKVIFLNDDKTTYEFVMTCLIGIFNKSASDAMKLTIEVDKKGKCIAGNGYTFEVASTKKNKVLLLAKQCGYPFQVTIEEDI